VPLRERSQRGINLAGPQILSHGLPRRIGQDLYQRLMTASWPPVFASFAAFLLSFNLAFTALYGLQGAGIANLNPPGY
jgi:hypothetical protein